ncbi:hypothetical protein E8E13_008866 [Curvularia kusanoi]|uniref:Uncharacterized protein n=1 Tax=Curvularia kusanoi TaxID=90978 RepID=A0A9P4TI72_CURKU|nr:hypothetical protein E8E13_008866 [Curvularia kusanoi]
MARSRAPGVPKTMSTRTIRSSTAEKRKRSPEAESAPAPAPAPKKARSATKAAPKKAAAAKKTVVSKVEGKTKIAEPTPTSVPSSPASSILSDLSEVPTELMTPSPPHTPVPIVTRALAPVSDRAAAPAPTPAPVTVRAPAAPAPVPAPVPATVITAPSPAAPTPAVSAKAPEPTPEPHPETLSLATHASIVAAVREVILPCLDLVEPMLEHTRACAKLPAGSRSEKMSYVDRQEARVLGVLADLRQQFGGVERKEGSEVIVDEQGEVEGAEERKDGGKDARGEEGQSGEVGQAEETVADEEVAEPMVAKKKKSPKRKTELELLGSPQGLTRTRSRASRV